MDATNPSFTLRCESNPALYTRCAMMWMGTWDDTSMDQLPAKFFDDIPEELRQPTELEKIQAKANKKDPRIPTLAAVIGILLIVGVPLFTSEPEIDPQLVRQGLQPKSLAVEVTWGVRFSRLDRAELFLRCVCGEVHRRLALPARPTPQLRARCERGTPRETA